MKTRVLGVTLLVVGTSIGGALLALPIVSARSGFIPSSLTLILCWLLMVSAALLVLEVNMWMPPTSNLISMARHTLGKGAAALAWFAYLFLFYSLLAAYLSSGSAIVGSIMGQFWHTSEAANIILFCIALGWVVMLGTRSVDYVNRTLMAIKLAAYLFLVGSVSFFVHVPALANAHPAFMFTAIPVMITSFGFATIVPTMRVYLEDDISSLRKVILFGSMIPLVCYLLWDLTVMGTITEDRGLLTLLNDPQPVAHMIEMLTDITHQTIIGVLAHLFTSVCVGTSFLGVGLGLSDFLSDGLGIAKRGRGTGWIAMATFLPPLGIALFFPDLFIKALGYAGLCCIFLLLLLPALMVWSGRYIKHLDHKASYKAPFSKSAILLLLLISSIIMISGIYELV